MSPSRAADAAILIDSIAAAAVAHVQAGNLEAAQRITRYAVVVLPVPVRVVRAWAEGDWDFASARTSAEALAAVRSLAA